MCKQLIGDFAIVKCDCYGEYNKIKDLNIGDDLILSKNLEVSINEGEKAFGTLKISDVDKKVIQPYLDAGWNDLYECKISQINSNVTINERLRATLWVKKR